MSENPCCLRKEIESQLWLNDGIKRGKMIPLESEIIKHLPDQGSFTPPRETPKHDDKPDFPGFTRYTQFSQSSPKIRRDVAYRCGACKIVILGAPEITTSPKFPNSLLYRCTSCESNMYIFDGEKEDPSTI